MTLSWPASERPALRMLRGATRARTSLAIQRLLRDSAVGDCDLASSQGARPNGASSNKTCGHRPSRVSRLSVQKPRTTASPRAQPLACAKSGSPSSAKNTQPTAWG